ncbi:hypothetical protein ABT009_39600 [Streptomyces sp. NPDC002896]|uniref:hypothetical protein n=1 Tax=Streptomyces sp. NPDC002896 TaxID=3154438 RepID=UPI00332212DD
MRAPASVHRLFRTAARTAVAVFGATVLATTLASAPASAQSGAFVWYDEDGESHVMEDPLGACIELVPPADPRYPVDNATDTIVQIFTNNCFATPVATLHPGERAMLSTDEPAYRIKVWSTD